MRIRTLGWMAAAGALWGTFPEQAARGQLITPVLGDAQSFAVLAGSTVTNTGDPATVITGDVGVWAGTAITGFAAVDGGPGIVNGTIYEGGAVPQAAQSSLTTAMNALNSVAPTGDLTGINLGTYNAGNALAPGVYSFPATSAQLTGDLVLDAGGVNGVVWVFQIGSALTTAPNATASIVNLGSNLGQDVGIFWVVGSSATLDDNTSFIGNILALESISMNAGATICGAGCGRALAQTGAVTLISNTICNVCAHDGDDNPFHGFSGGLVFNEDGELIPIPLENGNGNGPGPGPGVIPEPSTLMLVGLSVAGLVASRRRKDRES